MDQQVSDIDEAAKGREEFQVHLEQVGAKQGRGTAGLQAVEHEVMDLRAQVGPIEGKGTELGMSAGSRLHGGHDLLAHHIAKPVCADDGDAGDEEYQDQAEQAATGPQEDTLRAG